MSLRTLTGQRGGASPRSRGQNAEVGGGLLPRGPRLTQDAGARQTGDANRHLLASEGGPPCGAPGRTFNRLLCAASDVLCPAGTSCGGPDRTLSALVSWILNLPGFRLHFRHFRSKWPQAASDKAALDFPDMHRSEDPPPVSLSHRRTLQAFLEEARFLPGPCLD